MKPCELILFDVGGVLCELGEDPVPRSWIPGDRRFSMDDWFHSDLALAFERGEISAEKLAAEFRKDLCISQGIEEILAHFDDWLIGPYPGTLELLDSIPDTYRLAILSNTNAIHWPKIASQFGFQQYMERIFSSHLLGIAKPDPEVFHVVLEQLGVRPSDVLFLDDNQQNIETALRLGIQAERICGFDQLTTALCRRMTLR